MKESRRMVITLALGLGLTLALLWLLGDGLPIVHAVDFTVDVTNDENDGSCLPGDCSLREAIIAANGNDQADTITLGNGTYTLTLTGAGEDAAATGDLDVTETLSITGAGPDATIIDARGLSDRVLHILASNVVISGVTIHNGSGVDQGGGILNEATLTLINSMVISNSASDGGGIFNDGGVLKLTNSTIISNTADESGGGIKSDNGGMMELTNSTVSDNIAVMVDGGGIDNLGTAQLTNSTVSGNTAGHDGGGIDNWTDCTVELTNSTVSGNTASHDGGGIFNTGGVVTLTGSTVSGNTADVSGGGVKNDNGGMVELTNSTISANCAITDGGGIDNFQGGVVKLTNCTVSGNSAGRDGGGIDNWGEEDGIWGYSTVDLTNSTVSSNIAGFGGGIANQGAVQLANCTISSNTAYTMGGGINNFFFRTVELTNTIVASQTFGADCGWDPVTSFGYNLDSDGTCNFTATGDITNVNPFLGLLKNNGGDTETHALLPGSPAIDHIPNGVNGCGVVPLNKDQRGKTRPVDGDDNDTTACDIGAFEVQLKVYLPIIFKDVYP
jgi:CSLREA domain-containing protein